MARRGSWPTPTQHPEARNLGANRVEGPNSLAECARNGSPMWPTPRAEDSESTGAHRGEPDTLTSAVRLWPTPDAGTTGARDAKGRQGAPSLAHAILWPTPCSTDANGAGSRNVEGSLAHAGVSLTDAVRGDGGRGRWPTPSARDHKDGDSQSCANVPVNALLGRAAVRGAAVGLKLSPDWVEWLMGWPVCWSSLAPLAEATPRGWATDPGDTGEVPRTTLGIPDRRARLRAIGNGQVPQCAARAFAVLRAAREAAK